MTSHQLNKSVDILLFIQCNFSLFTCRKIFGNDDGDHLYTKWSQSNNNVLNFITRLDAKNKNKLFQWSLNETK